MADSPHIPTSFSASRRWASWLNVLLSVAAALALTVMANYLASGYYKRIQFAAASPFDLSPRTVNFLRALTNDVEVVIFFDQHGEPDLYGWVSGLLREYHHINPKIRVKTVDYTRFAGEAAQVLSRYKLNLKERDFVLIESGGNTKVYQKNELADMDLDPLLRGETREIRRKTFRGEMLFTSGIFAVTHPRPLAVYFLQGHGEHDPEDASGVYGYGKFADILKTENGAEWRKLVLGGTNEVPSDCQLLIVAGPSKARLGTNETEAISTYLARGGRLFALFNSLALGERSGLEDILAQWGVTAENNTVFDREHSGSGNDILAAEINPNHPVTKAMFAENLRFEFVLPRSLAAVEEVLKKPGAPRVEILFQTGTNAVARYPAPPQDGKPAFTYRKGGFPVMVAVEQGNIKGVSAERGATRIIAAGDSFCLNNELIELASNHYLAGRAVDWLLAQPDVMLEGLGPRPVKEYKLQIPRSDFIVLRWLFLAGIPGAVLFLGWLVWLRRRS